MKLLITGSTGFLGRHTVAHALGRGHEVRAVVRPAGSIEDLPWRQRVQLARVDLRSRRGLSEAVRGCDAVLHLAAAKSGDLYTQLAGTVVATENLLDAMTEAGVRHIVSISSFAVYDYRAMRSRSLLDESSPLEARPRERDEYCQTKLLQEQMVRRHAQEHGWKWTVLRPGVIFGTGETWTARLGLKVSDRLWVRTGAWARLPLTYVENCAEAIVAAVESGAAAGGVFNVVDDQTPTQRSYMRALLARMERPPRVIPISWTAMRLLTGGAHLANRLVFRGRAKVPQVLNPASFVARCRPLRFSNAALKRATGWSPRYSLEKALDRCFSRAEVETSPVETSRTVLTGAESA